MHLLIRAVSLAGQPLTQAISAYFDERGGTIGRADTNTLALPDPERRISRLQAEVVKSDDGYNIFNVGNANPIWQNEKAIGPGEGATLREGDELMIGSYALQVAMANNDETARTITKGRAAVDGRTVIVSSGTDPKTDPSLMTPIGVPTQFPGLSEPSVGAFPTPAPAAMSAAPSRPAPVPAPAPALAVPPSSPFADLLGSAPAAASAPLSAGAPAIVASPASPFADLFAPAPAPLASAPLAPRSAAPAAPVTRLPDDFDPFADLLGGSAQATPAPVGTAPRLPGDLDLMAELNPAGSAQSSSLDQMFGLGGGPSSADPLANFLKSTEPPVSQAAVGAPSAVDPLALLTPAAPVVPAAHVLSGEPPLRLPDHEPVTQAPLPDTTPEILGSMPLPAATPLAAHAEVPPVKTASLADQLAQRLADAEADHGAASASVPTPSRVEIGNAPYEPPPGVHRIPDDFAAQTAVPATPEVAKPVAAPVPSSAPVQSTTAPMAVDAQALWSAFCEGAGVSFVPPQGLNPDLMRVMGQLLRHAVDGTLRLVAARAATKQEMRAEVTVIQARRNNPLKFSPDTQSAMEQLLQPPLRGFMSGPEAVDDAMDDLLGHTIGTMAGMRAALEGVLARFEPDQLEAKLVGRSMLDSLLPMNRRAKLWELYLQHYGAVSGEAKEDFHNLFGKAFLQAYEEQLDRLDAERRQSKGRGPGQGGQA